MCRLLFLDESMNAKFFLDYFWRTLQIKKKNIYKQHILLCILKVEKLLKKHFSDIGEFTYAICLQNHYFYEK